MRVGFEITRSAASAPEQRSASIEDPTVPVSQTAEFLSFFGMDSVNLPRVTVESAMRVPAVTAAVTFLSRTLAALPLHAFARQNGSAERDEEVDKVLRNPTPEMDGFRARQYFWQQVFTGGRGLAWIERSGTALANIWMLNPSKVRIVRRGLGTVYIHDGTEYVASEIIDVAFALKPDQLGHYGPISLASKAIQLAIAMSDYAGNFFAGGGVPPLSISGPMPEGDAALRRAQADIERSIRLARSTGSPIMPIPAGHKLEAVGIDPDKGQMTEARLYQLQEIARIWQIPLAFLQDLSNGTFANVEQQDLHLVKHLVGQWAKAFEAQASLKIYGRDAASSRYVEHNLDGLLRGDFKSRIDALARGIQTAQLTPNEARRLENRPNHTNLAANDLLVQGATVPLGTQPLLPKPKETDSNAENQPA